MAGAKGGSSKGARSLGAAKGGGSGPSGAILDDTAEVLLERKQRFKAWAKGHRETKLKENAWTKMYNKDNRGN